MLCREPDIVRSRTARLFPVSWSETAKPTPVAASYDTPSAFAAVFRRETGQTPGSFFRA